MGPARATAPALFFGRGPVRGRAAAWKRARYGSRPKSGGSSSGNAAALAAVTRTQEIMVAVRPTFHSPALLAKQAANIDHITSGGARISTLL